MTKASLLPLTVILLLFACVPALGEENGERTGAAERRADRLDESFVRARSESPLSRIPKDRPHLPFFDLSALRLQT